MIKIASYSIPSSLKRTIFIGDVHGCLEQFLKLIQKVHFDVSKDRLVFMGDLVDRGPCSVSMIQWTRTMHNSFPQNVLMVMGNHEDKHLRYHLYEKNKKNDPSYKNPMQQMKYEKLEIQQNLNSDDWDFISRLPLAIDLSGWWVVHAGVRSGIDLPEQDKNDVLRLRILSKEGRFIKYDENNDTPEKGTHWSDLYNGLNPVVYGHNVHNILIPRVVNNTYGIDTGCCFGGNLTAMIWSHGDQSISYEQEKCPIAYRDLK